MKRTSNYKLLEVFLLVGFLTELCLYIHWPSMQNCLSRQHLLWWTVWPVQQWNCFLGLWRHAAFYLAGQPFFWSWISVMRDSFEITFILAQIENSIKKYATMLHRAKIILNSKTTKILTYKRLPFAMVF